MSNVTLQAELEQMKFSGFAQVVIQLNDKEIKAILATVSKHLPEKFVTNVSTWNIRPDYHRGYYTAITEMEKTLGADNE